MFPLDETTKEEDINFCWGQKKEKGCAGRNKDFQFYESFTLNGVEYFLYDCVQLWCENEPEPFIAKLVKIWETPKHKKKVKVVWFFRPTEIQNWLGDVEPLENEIFLASGEGEGLFNLNPLEAISGKCNVICTSKDKRNPRASMEELKTADYIFCRSFDVGSHRLSSSFADRIADTAVKHFFNSRKDQQCKTSELNENLTEKNAKRSFFVKVEGDRAVRNTVKDGKSIIIDEPKIAPSSLGKQTRLGDENTTVKPKVSGNKAWDGDARIPCGQVSVKAEMTYSDNVLPTDIRPVKKRKVQFTTVDSKGDPAKSSDTLPKLPLEVTRRPDEDASKWFKQQPCEERLQRAHEKGTLVLLENLDPSYTSSEVKDIVRDAFNAKADVKMVPCSTFSSPHYGKAFVIFKSKDAAEHAISELNRKCLMLTNGRPVVGRFRSPKKPTDTTGFVGHLVPKRFQRQRQEMRDAVSTSHYSQCNTIEYEMALEWRALQEKSNIWWKALHEQQAKEIKGLRGQLKYNHDG